MSVFLKKLEAQWAQGKFVCVGIDPQLERIPVGINDLPGSSTSIALHGDIKRICEFCRMIIDTTGDLALAFKPNIAFFERYGAFGLDLLERVCFHIRDNFPDVVLILDYKRGDIGATNIGYVRLAFEGMKADAVTINGYLGREANEPFLKQADKGVIVLCKTSNPGAGEFQDRRVVLAPDELAFMRATATGPWVEYYPGTEVPLLPMHRLLAHNVTHHWNKNGNCALVVGATYPQDLRVVRGICGDMPILIPGIGTQGGDLDATVEAGMDSRGWGMIVNSSSGIIHASSGMDFAQVARAKTIELNSRILIRRDQVLATRNA